MFIAGKSAPKMGEVRLGRVMQDGPNRNGTHRYIGVRPYLVVSNDTYNKMSGQTEVIPFTTKRRNSHNPVHVDYNVGEVDGLTQDSTLIIEGRDVLPNDDLSEPLGLFNIGNWKKAAKAMVTQCPCLAMAFDESVVGVGC